MFQLDTEFPPLISSITELSHLMTVFNRWVVMLVLVMMMMIMMMIMMMVIVMMMMMLPSSANFYIYLIKHRCSRGSQQGETIVMADTNTVLVRALLHANCRRLESNLADLFDTSGALVMKMYWEIVSELLVLAGDMDIFRGVLTFDKCALWAHGQDVL